jgi:phosphinothricin acetyltransferase
LKKELKIRSFNKADWTSVSRIYAEGMSTGIATFETEVPSYDIWNQKFLNEPRLVAHRGDEVLGYAVLSQVSKREVYKGVAEVTIYVDLNHKGKGIGKKLLSALVEESEKAGFWTLQAVIFTENMASIALHKYCGFQEVGVRKKIGQRNGKWYDNYLFEKRSENI